MESLLCTISMTSFSLQIKKHELNYIYGMFKSIKCNGF